MPALDTLIAANNPVLPDPSTMKLALYIGWSLVLGSGTFWITSCLHRPYRFGLASIVIAATLVPGISSPAYWLGLAFQTPSVTTCGICLAYLGAQLFNSHTVAPQIKVSGINFLNILATVYVVLGWVLLLDTLAWLPISIYALGFSSAAFACVAIAAALVWVLFANNMQNVTANQLAPAVILVVLTLYVLTRLPTGNVWDAVLDPWLWLALHWYLVQLVLRPRPSETLHQPLAPE